MLLNFIPVLPSLGTIAYYSSPHSVQRKLAITSVVTFALVFPWTLYSIMPVNRQLFKINAAKDEQLAGGGWESCCWRLTSSFSGFLRHTKGNEAES